MQHVSPRWGIVRRWGSLLTAALVAAGMFVLLGFGFRKSLPLFLDLPLWVVVVGSACVLILAVALGSGRLSALIGVRHSLT